MLCLMLVTASVAGCRSSRSFAIDSNSRSPWFGLSLPLPQASSKRKTLETISDSSPQQARIATAESRTTKSESAPVRSLLPKWLGGTEPGVPLPPDAPRIDAEAAIRLEGPREEFR